MLRQHLIVSAFLISVVIAAYLVWKSIAPNTVAVFDGPDGQHCDFPPPPVAGCSVKITDAHEMVCTCDGKPWPTLRGH
jgi:hypothetical protein